MRIKATSAPIPSKIKSERYFPRDQKVRYICDAIKYFEEDEEASQLTAQLGK